MRKAWGRHRPGLDICKSCLRESACLWSGLWMKSTLISTELNCTRQTVKEDKSHIYEDWKECILPLVDFGPLKLNPKSFQVEQYLAAKSLVSSRAFEIDDYHGYGMVPLADLFNHKTGAEDIHFTSVCSHPGSNDGDNIESNDEYDRNADEDLLTENFHSRDSCSLTADAGNYYLNCSDVDSSSNSGDDPMILELILVKDVKAGDEVFNTYGSMGNAALLHRYGFTEPDNPFDIVNIELNLVTKWSSSLFSARYTRARLLFWRRLGFSGCISHSCEYFEISSDGEPQLELVILLYIICLPEVVYDKLNNRVSSVENINESMNILLLHKNNAEVPLGTTEIDKDLLLTKNVCDALHSLVDIRESFYGQNSLEDDMEALRTCCMRERKLYHSLTLRVTERRILKKLRTYASSR
uniref:SET domain-containing protein n=1 Tax=Nelumbo nucifera TaxID=4432 RepID=A0A822Z155_NELNU|nr:TPA_asm: hypothetical protein HUJ06_007826 [Nelumbo nucifera]